MPESTMKIKMIDGQICLSIDDSLGIMMSPEDAEQLGFDLLITVNKIKLNEVLTE